MWRSGQAGKIAAVFLSALMATWILGGAAYRRARVALAICAAHEALGRCEHKRALAELQRVESLAPKNAELVYLLAVASRRGDNLTAVEPYLRRAADLGWQPDDIKRQRMMAAFQAGDSAVSETYLSRLMSDGVSDDVALEVYECLAKGRMAAYRLHDALVCLDHWIQWRPNDVQPLYWRAAIWSAVDHSLREESDLKRVLEIEPGHLEARFRYAECLMRLNKTADAIAQVTYCHERAPDDLSYTVLLARCYLRAGRRGDAKHLLSAPMPTAGDPHLRSQALSLLGQIELEDEHYERAVEVLSRCVELDADAANAHYLLGRALARIGKRAEAETHFAKSDAINRGGSRLHDLGRTMINHPNDEELKIETAEALIEHDMLDDALAVMLSLVRAGRGGAHAQRTLAAIYDRQGHGELARRHRDAASESEKSGAQASTLTAAGTNKVAP